MAMHPKWLCFWGLSKDVLPKTKYLSLVNGMLQYVIIAIVQGYKMYQFLFGFDFQKPFWWKKKSLLQIW